MDLEAFIEDKAQFVPPFTKKHLVITMVTDVDSNQIDKINCMALESTKRFVKKDVIEENVNKYIMNARYKPFFGYIRCIGIKDIISNHVTILSKILLDTEEKMIKQFIELTHNNYIIFDNKESSINFMFRRMLFSDFKDNFLFPLSYLEKWNRDILDFEDTFGCSVLEYAYYTNQIESVNSYSSYILDDEDLVNYVMTKLDIMTKAASRYYKHIQVSFK